MVSAPDEKPETRLRRRAMDFLARREHTFSELRHKLQTRFPDDDPDLIDTVLGQLQDENLLSDVRFLESYIHTRMRAGMGPLKIGYELRQKGVADQEAEAGLAAIDRETWLELAKTHLERRFGDLPPDMKARQKAWRFLQQRGFDGELVARVMKRASSSG